MKYQVNLISSDKNQLEFYTEATSEEDAIRNAEKYITASGWEQYQYTVNHINIVNGE